MEKFVIKRNSLYKLIYDTMCRASSVLPGDVKEAFKRALNDETQEIAKWHLSTTLKNQEIAEKNKIFCCPDTGYPLYYMRIGDNIEVEEGFSSIHHICKEVTSKITEEAKLRKTIVDPFTHYNPGTNVVSGMPKVEIIFDSEIEYIEITACPKGGGSEIFGTFYKMMVPADGEKGILKFIYESAKKAMQNGKTCPPNVLGVGIGGTADLCMKLAKEACLLRPIGDRHPEERIAKLEDKILKDINSLGIGPMGSGGLTTCFDVHIEYAGVHTAALPVAFNTQCSICRRSTSILYKDRTTEIRDYPEWFKRS